MNCAFLEIRKNSSSQFTLHHQGSVFSIISRLHGILNSELSVKSVSIFLLYTFIKVIFVFIWQQLQHDLIPWIIAKNIALTKLRRTKVII